MPLTINKLKKKTFGLESEHYFIYEYFKTFQDSLHGSMA